MLKTIIDSYKMFLKNLPVIILFAIPLLALASIEIYFEGLSSSDRGVKYFMALSVLLLPIVSAATDIALYRRFFKFQRVNPFLNLKTLFLYLFSQIGLGLIASLPIIIFRYIFSTFVDAPFYVMLVALLLNMFIGIYFLARFNILLPLIVLEKVPSLKTFLAYTKQSYRKWLLVAFIIYLPFIVLNYGISCPYLNMAATNMFMFVFVCFNTIFVSVHKPREIKSTPTTTITIPVTETVKKSAPVKVEVKQPAPKKKEPKKEEPSKAPAKKETKPKKTTLKPVKV